VPDPDPESTVPDPESTVPDPESAPVGEPRTVATREHPAEPGVAGLILTGGRSARMGRDKASLVIGGMPLARHLAMMLATTTQPTLEVGPGRSGLETTDPDPGEGPLAAIAAGWRSLEMRGHDGPVIVIATDLPSLTVSVLAWLAARPETVSVVPVVAGRPQSLCARWCPADLDRAVELVGAGERAVHTALGPATAFLGEDVWGSVASAQVFEDVDRPEDLAGRQDLGGREDLTGSVDLAQSS
jgi:molybdopterin-guanine dinucleotide biosynthesis protein A